MTIDPAAAAASTGDGDMTWIGWLLFAACCAASFGIGWTARGAAYERTEETGT